MPYALAGLSDYQRGSLPPTGSRVGGVGVMGKG